MKRFYLEENILKISRRKQIVRKFTTLILSEKIYNLNTCRSDHAEMDKITTNARPSLSILNSIPERKKYIAII